MLKGFISQNCKLVKVADQAGAATTDVTSASVDMAGWDGVMFFTSYATPAANNLIHVEQSSDDGVGDAFADVAGSEADLSGASDEDQYVDILNPQERYLRCIAQRGTSTASGDIWALLYRGKTPPNTLNLSGTIYGKRLIHPAAGTK